MQIVRWSSQMGLDEAAQTLLAEGFEPEKADMDDPAALDLWWIAGLWSKVGPAARRERQRLGEPRIFENFEALVTAAG